jgi:KDO2-lipid IV(A) lauroyltransferase
MPIRLRYLIEYAALRLLLGLADILPYAPLERFFSGLAHLWFILDVRRRRIAVDNLLKSGLAPDSREARRLAGESFRHFAVLVLESLKCDRVLNESNWRESVEMDIPAETMALLEDPARGVILVSGHLGNWEVAAQLVSFMKPIVGIARNFDNPYTNRLMASRKPRNRYRLTPKHDMDMGRLISVVRHGEILAILIDQHARVGGMKIDFFGRPASTHTSPAMLHLITRIPIVFGYCLRIGPMRYRFKAMAPIIQKPTGNREADTRRLLETLTRALEQAVKEAPGQYLWAHRRWR